MSNLSTIVSFFEAKGVPSYLIAGIVGNMKWESGFDPTAGNAREGAIGLVQWEGGRRTDLQEFAARRGTSETDLHTQLDFLWHEMNSAESEAWQKVQTATNAAGAAALWDSYYERSSGSTHQQRIDSAVEYFQTGKIAGGDYTTNSAGESTLAGSDPTKNDYGAVDSLGGLLDSVPALRDLVTQAMDQGWSVAKFQNEVQDSQWWKNHSETARQVLITQANDPATYHQNLNAAVATIKTLEGQLGFTLDPDQLQNIARTALLTGNASNNEWLAKAIGRRQDYSHLASTDDLTGQMAGNVQQLQQIAGAYGLKWGPTQLANRARQIAIGGTTIDTFKQQAIEFAKSAFPSFAKQLAEGQTMMDIANPYIQSASQLLEIDPSKFDLYNPLIRKGLQGTQAKAGEPPSNMPLWQFEQTVRNDPRWQYTNNARQQMASMALQLGQAWGFNG